MQFIDFDDFEQIKGRGYRGNAGRKIAINIDGDVWMLKFPESTRSFAGRAKANNHLPSYTTSPLSEYIGSKFYDTLGVPAHEVLLGHREGKVVVACRDFCVDRDLIEFSMIKNTIDDDVLLGRSGSDSRREYLSDALAVIRDAPDFEDMRDEVLERFWDMFVVDAVIMNNDRNNGNWGLLSGRYKIELAPVFDNGNAFFNKRTPSLISARLESPASITNDLDCGVSYFVSDEGKSIHPFKFMAGMLDEDCNNAVTRFARRFEPSRINTVIDEIPIEVDGIRVMSTDSKEYHKALIADAADRVLSIAASLDCREAAMSDYASAPASPKQSLAEVKDEYQR